MSSTVIGSRLRARTTASAVSGMLAALLSLATSELLAALLPGATSLVLAVGAGVVDLAPPPVKNFAVDVFGTADKPALLVGIVVLSAAAGAALGVAAARRFSIATMGFAAFGVLGAAAGFADPQASRVVCVVSAAVSVLVGVGTLRRLLDAAPEGEPVEDRRRFLVLATSVFGLALVGGGIGRWIVRGRAKMLAERAAVELPLARQPLAAPAASTSLDVQGLSPLVTPNARFYRIDTALTVPQIDLETWRLGIGGMVDRPVSLSFDDLLAMDLVEADVTIACVSNEIGGNLIGNARWLGVPLATLLERVGVRPGADQIVGQSVDGWTAGFPTAVARDGRDALVAVGMNGEPLPLEHGFPARLVVPGLYGYVSATKWLSGIYLVTWDGFDGYWVPRGWSKEGPIKTQSRIDVPTRGAVIPSGPTTIAGVAWAQHRGISAVEVQIDDGSWLPAQLSGELHVDTWRQWALQWDAPPGSHLIRVRATDGRGVTQTAASAPVIPNGATGHHTIRVTVR